MTSRACLRLLKLNGSLITKLKFWNKLPNGKNELSKFFSRSLDVNTILSRVGLHQCMLVYHSGKAGFYRAYKNLSHDLIMLTSSLTVK